MFVFSNTMHFKCWHSFSCRTWDSFYNWFFASIIPCHRIEVVSIFIVMQLFRWVLLIAHWTPQESIKLYMLCWSNTPMYHKHLCFTRKMLNMMIHTDALVCDMLSVLPRATIKNVESKNNKYRFDDHMKHRFFYVFVAIMIVSINLFVFIQLSSRAININELSAISWFKADLKFHHVSSQL